MSNQQLIIALAGILIINGITIMLVVSRKRTRIKAPQYVVTESGRLVDNDRSRKDAAAFIARMIGTSLTPLHFDCCNRAIDLYKERFGKDETFGDLVAEYNGRIVTVHEAK